jgi:hypothetical protein
MLGWQCRYKSVINRIDQSPENAKVTMRENVNGDNEFTMSSSDSSSFSSFFSSAFGASVAAPPVAAAAGAAPAAGAPPPEPTLDSRSFTFFPSSAFARRDAHIGSNSMSAARVSAKILSDYRMDIYFSAFNL